MCWSPTSDYSEFIHRIKIAGACGNSMSLCHTVVPFHIPTTNAWEFGASLLKKLFLVGLLAPRGCVGRICAHGLAPG